MKNPVKAFLLLFLAFVACEILVLAAHAQQGPPQATLTWTGPSVPTPAALFYKVQRATVAAGPFTQIAAPTAATYVDTAVVRGQAYFYRVFSACPVTGAGCGTAASPINGDSSLFAASNGTIPNATTTPVAPTNLTIDFGQ